MNLVFLPPDHQEPTEPWGQEVERGGLIFLDRNIVTEEAPQLRPGIEVDMNWGFTVFNLPFPLAAVPEKTHQ
jgi:hypothetical protein